MFARYLDECLLSRGSAGEQRARIFKLIDQYCEYTQDRADTLRKRHNLEVTAHSGALWHTSQADDDGMDLDTVQPPNLKEQVETWEEEAQTWDLLRRLLPSPLGLLVPRLRAVRRRRRCRRPVSALLPRRPARISSRCRRLRLALGLAAVSTSAPSALSSAAQSCCLEVADVFAELRRSCSVSEAYC